MSQEEAFRRSVNAEIQAAIVKEKSEGSDPPKGNFNELLLAMNIAAADAHTIREEVLPEMMKEVGEETSGAIDQALNQLREYKVLEGKSLIAQKKLKDFFLQSLAKLLITPAQQRLDALNAQENSNDVAVAAHDVTEIDQQSDDVFMSEGVHIADHEENAMIHTHSMDLVTYCLSNRDTVPPQYGKTYLETHKTLKHFCMHIFVWVWEAHFAIHVFSQGFANMYTKQIPMSEENRRYWLVNQYIRHSPKPIEVILSEGGPLPPSVLDESVLDSVRTINALTYEPNSLRQIQHAPLTDTPEVLFRIVIVLDRGQGRFSGGYYDFNPFGFRDKDSRQGRINVECTEDKELLAACTNDVNMKKWYLPIITDFGHVAVPASILSRAFKQFTNEKGQKYNFVGASRNNMNSAVADAESEVFVYASGQRNVYMSNLDLVFVDNAREMNIFMNECEYENGGNHCSSKVIVYDEVSYCFSADFFAKHQQVQLSKKRKDHPSTDPEFRGTQDLRNLAARACNFVSAPHA